MSLWSFNRPRKLDETGAIKITWTPGFADTEYNGNIARFSGQMRPSGFSAIVRSMRWVRHIGPLREDEQLEFMRAVQEYSRGSDKEIVFTNETYDELEL